MKCAICDFETDNTGKFRNHLRFTHKLSTKDYYDTYLKAEGEEFCQYCGKPTVFKGLTKGGYRRHCSVRCSTLDPKVQEKLKATNLEKYGVENPYQSEEIKERIKQDRLAKFGVDHPLKRKEIAKKVGIKSAQTKYKIKDDFISEHPELITKEQLTEKYGWMWYWDNVIEPVKMLQGGRYTNYYYISDIPKIETYIEETIHKNRSHKEMELLRFVQSIYGGTVKHNCKSVISPKEIDIYLPDLQLGIEYNGTRWHSIEMGTPKDYHLDKSLKCRDLGIRLIHIYEFEDFEEQKHLIKDLILGQDNYPKNDFNKNNLIELILQPEIIYNDGYYTIYGAGKLIQNNDLELDTLVEVKE